MGPRDRISGVNNTGNGIHVPRDPPRHSGTLAPGAHISSGSSNGSALHRGLRGGTFHVNPSGNRNLTKK
jgi:hypothetical protein